MARRSWRNFDYLLLGTLFILSALGATMVYSATMNTLGLEDALRRQITFIGAGLIVLLITASIDYRLLDIIHKTTHLTIRRDTSFILKLSLTVSRNY